MKDNKRNRWDELLMEQNELLYQIEQSEKPMLFEEVVAYFSLEEVAEIKELKKQLDLAVQQGDLVLTRKNRYGTPQQLGLVNGTIQKNTRGFGFLHIDGVDEDIFLAAGDLNGALHNDKVLVRLKKQAMTDRNGNHYRAEGEVVRILERHHQRFVGVLELQENYGYVIPDDKRFPTDIFIAQEGICGAENGEKVLVEITKWGLMEITRKKVCKTLAEQLADVQ